MQRRLIPETELVELEKRMATNEFGPFSEILINLITTVRHERECNADLETEIGRLRAEVAALLSARVFCSHQFTGSTLSSESRCSKCGASYGVVMREAGENVP